MASRIFEVALYNAEVRRLLDQGERHTDYPDAWSTTHYLEVRASSREEARSRIEHRYPSRRGFVIEDLREVTD